MSATIPDSHVDLLEGPVHVALATLMPDGQPQVTVVWCNYDGEYVLVNTARGRQKEQNMNERPKVTILAVDPDDPYRWLEVRGTVEEMTEEGAVDHISNLARLYKDVPAYYGYAAPAERRNRETRVMVKIRPTHVNAYGE
ncbi:MAG TPA: PPOX class F420-dependent oxidoreductase [Anaerolineae bacterium]